MATLSKILNLTNGIWQEIGAVSFIGQQSKKNLPIQLVNADALPVGDVPEAMSRIQTVELITPAPATGSWYCRVRAGSQTTFKFSEV